jgi:hypothetical protein
MLREDWGRGRRLERSPRFDEDTGREGVILEKLDVKILEQDSHVIFRIAPVVRRVSVVLEAGRASGCDERAPWPYDGFQVLDC